jgi:hypothetical protein
MMKRVAMLGRRRFSKANKDMINHLKSLSQEDLKTELYKALHQNSIARTEEDDEPVAQPLPEKVLSTGYYSDERSGDEVTDSDQEFE